MRNIFDKLAVVQAGWLYFEPIFKSLAIQTQIPVEGAMFEEVNAIW